MTSTTMPMAPRPATVRSGGISGSIRGKALRAADAVLTWLQRDRDRRALQALDDRLLRDIGISRSDVEQEVTKPFWRS